MSNAEQVRELLTGALALLDEPRHRNGDPKSAKVTIGALIPDGVELYASQARSDRLRDGTVRPGKWFYYLVMPSGWKPSEGGRRWIQNPDSGRYWDTSSGSAHGEPNTREIALAAGAIRLMETML